MTAKGLNEVGTHRKSGRVKVQALNDPCNSINTNGPHDLVSQIKYFCIDLRWDRRSAVMELVE
jgi:hypothetical protein